MPCYLYNFQKAGSDLREEELMKPSHLKPILTSLDTDGAAQ